MTGHGAKFGRKKEEAVKARAAYYILTLARLSQN
jgi:hypothetical protein